MCNFANRMGRLLTICVMMMAVGAAAFAQQYQPEGQAFVCVNGTNRFTRALYGSHTDWRVETSDRPVFALVKKNHHRNLRFRVNGVPLDSTDYCKASYVNGMRIYSLKDHRWG